MDQYRGIDIHNGQKQHIAIPAMYVYILNIHRQVLQRPFSARRSKTNKIPLKWLRPDFPSVQQFVLLHQPVNLLMIDDPAQVLQFASHIAIPVTTELLVQRFFNILYYRCIFKELTVIVCTVRAGFDSFISSRLFIIKTAGPYFRPPQYTPGCYTSENIGFYWALQPPLEGTLLFFKARS